MWPSAVFWEMWGFRFADTTTISQEQLSTFPTQKPLTALIRPERGGDLYYIDNGGKKYHIPEGVELWNNWGFSLSEVSVISNEQFDTLPFAGDLTLYATGHLTPWLFCKMTYGRCIMTDPGNNKITTLTQGQFDLLRKR